MTHIDIPQRRLYYQQLLDPKFISVEEVVAWLGAVQAQDFAAAKWGVGMRMQHATDKIVEEAFNTGKILRTHMMRPTWHFVTPENISWILKLTSPRVQALNTHMYRKTELDGALFMKCHHILEKCLQKNNYLTRTEIAGVFLQHNIQATGQRLAYILMHAELEGLICSGPRKGKQFTYALLRERTPRIPNADREETLSRLVRIYFTSHGPAQAKDFSWWSGLSMKDTLEGLGLAKGKLQKEEIDGKVYYCSQKVNVTLKKIPRVYLLSIFDEYTIAYRDRSSLGGQGYVEKLLSMGNALTAVIIHDGVIIGTWKRILKKGTVHVIPSFFNKITNEIHQEFVSEAKKYAHFLSLKLDV